MQDILVKADENGGYDIVVEGSDFASAEGFETAIPTSYFSDARASTVQVQQAGSRRGWVGNILYIDQERELGGLLWTLDQARNTEDTRNFAKAYAEDSLKWLIEDGIARTVLAKVVKVDDRTIKIFTNITTIDNTTFPYVTLWQSTDISRTIT